VLAATNSSIGELRGSREFRDDFFYRLCSDLVEVPPLRHRLREEPAELVTLLGHIVPRIVGDEAPGLVEMAREVLGEELGPEHRWPGNVRELEQRVRRIIVTRRSLVRPEAREWSEPSCGPEIGGAVGALAEEMDAESLGGRELLGRYCALLYERHGSYREVGRISGFDRRTVRRYVEESSANERGG
jgi:DNA-binding NtrC family response regulator